MAKKSGDSVYKVVELVGTSAKSWEEAAKNAVETAAATLRDLRVGEIVKLDMTVDDGKVTMIALAWMYLSKLEPEIRDCEMCTPESLAQSMLLAWAAPFCLPISYNIYMQWRHRDANAAHSALTFGSQLRQPASAVTFRPARRSFLRL